MGYLVTPGAVGPLKLSETDTLTSVLQNVDIILRTFEGTVPLCREFGISAEFMSKPIPVAKAMLHTEIKEKVERYEPRVTVVGVSFQENGDKLIPTVEVELRE